MLAVTCENINFLLTDTTSTDIVKDRYFFQKRSVNRAAIACAVLMALNSLTSSAQDQAGKEILYPSKEFAKLDTFEGVNLEDADKLFGKKDYKGAYAAYKAYSFEFAKSKALPYVLLRMGRCLHLVEKRNAAIKAYQDVVDYFPDDVRYAAAALYHIGECHGLNGDEAKKTATWAKMVKDDDYVSQPNSGTALTYLGNAMEKLGKFEEAAEYHWRTATAFLKSNDRAAAAARSAVISHYAVRSPNHDKLKEFYTAASGFDGRGKKVDKPEEDTRYWSTVFSTVLNKRAKIETDKRKTAAAYWAAKMGDRFVENDDLRKQWADAHFVSEKDAEAWKARLDKQFASKTADIKRVLQWCSYYKVDPKMRSAFFAEKSKSFLAAMKNDEKMSLMNKLRHPHGMHEEAQAVMRSVRTQGMSDEELVKYTQFVAYYEPEETVLRYFARLKDKAMATKARFDYYSARTHRNNPNAEKALLEIPTLLKNPKYADGMMLRQAQLLHQVGRHEEAIKAYQAANVQPTSTWGVTDCLIALKQYAKAVKTVQDLESVGGKTAAQAALKVADIYRISSQKGKEVTQLRLILRRYPKTGQSGEAHNRLESYGVALTGGEAEAQD
ncbi:MAG: tetratricopeptide repeat protein [Akkermansiaceae bacterium]